METKGAIFGSDKSLKSKNQWLICGYILLNFVGFIFVVNGLELLTHTWNHAQINWTNTIFPVFAVYAIATLLSFILLGLLSPNLRDCLVHLRLSYPLPGCRAFNEYARNDHRIDLNSLKQKYGVLPEDPIIQNQLWFSASIKHKDNLGIIESHRTYLAAREIATVSWVLLLLLPVSAYILTSDILSTSIYGLSLFFLSLIWSIVADRYGIRFVENVLAVESHC